MKKRTVLTPFTQKLTGAKTVNEFIVKEEIKKIEKEIGESNETEANNLETLENIPIEEEEYVSDIELEDTEEKEEDTKTINNNKNRDANISEENGGEKVQEKEIDKRISSEEVLIKLEEAEKERLIKERNEYIVELRKKWMVNNTIIKHINTISAGKGWVPISLKDIQFILTQMGKEHRVSARNVSDYEFMEKEIAFEHQERMIEKIARHIDKKEAEDYNWKPFEFVAYIRDMNLIRQNLIENKGWNLSKRPDIIVNNNNLNIFSEASNELVTEKPAEMNEVIKLLNESLDG